MTNYEKFVKTFPNIPDLSGFDLWGDFWDEEYCEDKNIAKRVEKLINSIKNDIETPDDAQMSDEDMAKYVAKLRDSIKIDLTNDHLANMADKKQIMSWLEGLAQDDWPMFHSDSEVQEIAKNALELLEEQDNCENCAIAIEDRQSVVRCKDCIHCGKSEKCVLAAVSKEKNFPLFMLDNRGEWFCADGVAKDINVPGKEGR